MRQKSRKNPTANNPATSQGSGPSPARQSSQSSSAARTVNKPSPPTAKTILDKKTGKSRTPTKGRIAPKTKGSPPSLPSTRGKVAGTPPPTSKTPPAPAVSKRAPRETPEDMADRLIKTFPPEFNRLHEYLKTARGVAAALRNGLVHNLTMKELFYLIASCVETLAEDRIDRLFDAEYRRPLAALRLAAGLAENEFFKPDDPRITEEYQRLYEDFREKKRSCLAHLLRESGQQEAAELVLKDYAEYRRRRNEGRDLFVAHDPLDPFVAQVVAGHPSSDE